MSDNISVVFPVLIRDTKQLSMTMKCLELAKKNTALPFELIIVETASQYLVDEGDIYVYEKEITTPEKSHNRGFRMANSSFIGLLTNDVFVSEGWLECLVDCFNSRKDCGAATLASTQFGHTKENKIEEGNWWSVALLRREIFESVGYYDERFVNCWCDTDLLVRMYKQGWKMYRNFNCVVDHLVGQTNYAKPGFQENYVQGRQLFRDKHEGCGLEIYEATK